MCLDKALWKLLCIPGHSLVKATVFSWTEHFRGYCLSVDRELPRLLCIRGHSLVKAFVCP